VLSKSKQSCASEIRPLLSADVFKPARSRLWWLPVHVACIALCVSAIAQDWVGFGWQLLLTLPIGASFAGLTFLAHETLHGAIVRGKRLRSVVGFLGFLPFVVSPRLWVAWHNRVHHGNTNKPGVDPDAYPTLKEYENSRLVRWVTEYGAPGLSRLRGALALLFGFSVQSAHMLLDARRSRMLSRSEHSYALLETGLGWCVWLGLAYWLGPADFLLAYGLPLLFANAIVMGLILTNHSLSPHTDENDPLTSSLSVTGPPLIEWLTMHFGFHVEHHLFPSMSGRYAPKVRDALRLRFPERYQSLPFWNAQRRLHGSPRVYADSTTLVDPKTGVTWPALAPFAASRQ
jgi:fatty acid desaturase